jgi:hypothetical protein
VPEAILPSGLTLARSTADKPVPGIDASEFPVLFCMHDPTVRQWIADMRKDGAAVVVADEAWRNPGGYETLEFGIFEADAERVQRVRDGDRSAGH